VTLEIVFGKQEERSTGKEVKRINCYNTGDKSKEMDYNAVLFVPVTKGGVLTK
jgi:hypothetical protein